MKFFSIFLLLFLSLSAPLNPKAFAADYHSARTAALGGAGHAAPLLNDTIYLNPSYAAFTETQNLSTSWQSYKGKDAGTGHKGHVVHVSAFDGRSPLFHAGLGYTKRPGATFINVGAGKSVIERTGFGVGGKYFFNSHQNGQDFNLSFSGILTEWFYTSLMIDNLLQTETGKDFGLLREFNLGMKANIMSIVLVYLDPHITPHRPSDLRFGASLGLEFVLMKDLFFRMGFFKNEPIPFQTSRSRGVAIGFGWFAPRFSLDYGFQRVNHSDPGRPVTLAHNFGFTLFL